MSGHGGLQALEIGGLEDGPAPQGVAAPALLLLLLLGGRGHVARPPARWRGWVHGVCLGGWVGGLGWVGSRIIIG